MATPATAYLVVRREDGYGDVFPLSDGQRFTLGRADSNRIVLKDELCSREQAEVYHADGRWRLRDLESLNGTRINSEPLDSEWELSPGDEMNVGRTHLIFVEDMGQLPNLPDRPAADGVSIKKRLAESPILTASRADAKEHSEATGCLKSGVAARQRRSRDLSLLCRLGLDMGSAGSYQELARIAVQAEAIPRITPEFLAEELRSLGQSYFRQEYECSFQALEGLVYPDFARCVVDGPAPCEDPGPRAGAAGREGERKVGGIDFGFRNPFAAVWGVVDRDGVLWLTGEHYARQKPLSYHAARLPRDVLWYADPAGAQERAELLHAGFKVNTGNNALGMGIAAVTARLGAGTLKVVRGRCPNLLAEAELYRYGEGSDSEAPVDDHNHALAALRYLITRLDASRMARPDAPPPEAAKPPRKAVPEWWRWFTDPDIWTRLD